MNTPSTMCMCALAMQLSGLNMDRLLQSFIKDVYHGKGHSILSPMQLEHFGIHVNDKSRYAGGAQCIVTPDGYVIPLAIKNGLPYLELRASH